MKTLYAILLMLPFIGVLSFFMWKDKDLRAAVFFLLSILVFGVIVLSFLYGLVLLIS